MLLMVGWLNRPAFKIPRRGRTQVLHMGFIANTNPLGLQVSSDPFSRNRLNLCDCEQFDVLVLCASYHAAGSGCSLAFSKLAADSRN